MATHQPDMRLDDIAPPIERSKYRYRPFRPKSRDIRLLRICPSDGLASSLVCELVQFELDEFGYLETAYSAELTTASVKYKRLPPYIALSYVWGDRSERCNVTIDGFCVSVTRNLFEALQHIRALPHWGARNKTVEWLWVDALCFNQKDDTAEKHSQLPRMDDIYSQADAVYAWLGPEGSGSKRVMRRMKNCISVRRNTLRESRSCSKLRGASDSWMKSLEEGELRAQHFHDLREELCAFAERRFWRRVWIIQEVTLAREVVLVCGKDLVEWRGLEKMVESISWSYGGVAAMKHLCRRRADHEDNKQIMMLRALWDTKAAEATFPIDKIYAMLAMVSDWKNFLETALPDITEAGLCTKMTLRWMERRQSLDIMLLAPFETHLRPTLKSWCPDFLHLSSRAADSRSQAAFISYLTDWNPPKLGQRERWWNTTCHSRLTASCFQKRSDFCLELNAILVDRIETISYTERDGGVQPPRYGQKRFISGDAGEAVHPFEQHKRGVRQKLCKALRLYDPAYNDEELGGLFLSIITFADFKRRYTSEPLQRFIEHASGLKTWLQRNFYFLVKYYADSGRLGYLFGLAEHIGYLVLAAFGSSVFQYVYRFIEQSGDRALMMNQGFSLAKARWGGLKVRSIYKQMLPSDITNRYKTYGPSGRDPLEMVLEKLLLHDEARHQAFYKSVNALQALVDEGMPLMVTQYGDIGWAPPHAEVDDGIYLLEGCTVPVVLRQVQRDTNGRSKYAVVGRAYVPELMDGSFWNAHCHECRPLIVT